MKTMPDTKDDELRAGNPHELGRKILKLACLEDAPSNSNLLSYFRIMLDPPRKGPLV